ncbi:MAG: helix-turn-helix domain-containing protein [Methylococcales bacterium]|nr:helix-turn-helix domain-containing protein [Methylococcales bacterium]
MSDTKNLSKDDKLLTTESAAAFLVIPAATLTKWRSTGAYNLPYVKIGHAVRYRRQDLDRWLDAHLRETGRPTAKRPDDGRLRHNRQKTEIELQP